MKKKKNKKILLFLVICLVFLATFFTYNTFSFFKSVGTSSSGVKVAKFEIFLNKSNNLEQTINLEKTITPNNYSNDYVMPGTSGDIVIELDFKNVDVVTDYVVELGTFDLPNNLKLYSDSSYLNEFSSINGSYLLDGNTIYTHHIYWKWEYKTDSASDENDNLYMNRDLQLPVNVTANQRIGGGN